jgi:hypothetical protein
MASSNSAYASSVTSSLRPRSPALLTSSSSDPSWL